RRPMRASAATTLASVPPKVTSSSRACSSRTGAREARRRSTSPRVTTSYEGSAAIVRDRPPPGGPDGDKPAASLMRSPCPSRGGPAPVHEEGLPREVVGGRRGEEQDGADQVVRLAGAGGGGPACHAVHPLRVGEERRRQCGLDVPGPHRVDLHVVRRPLDR